MKAPTVLHNINNKYLMVSRDMFIYNSDFLRGIYDRPRNIFDVFIELEDKDLVELEIHFSKIDM